MNDRKDIPQDQKSPSSHLDKLARGPRQNIFEFLDSKSITGCVTLNKEIRNFVTSPSIKWLQAKQSCGFNLAGASYYRQIFEKNPDLFVALTTFLKIDQPSKINDDLLETKNNKQENDKENFFAAIVRNDDEEKGFNDPNV